MKALIFASIFTCLLFLLSLGSAQSEEKQVVVNLMIDADVPPSPSQEQGYQTESMLNAMLTEIEGRSWVPPSSQPRMFLLLTPGCASHG